MSAHTPLKTSLNAVTNFGTFTSDKSQVNEGKKSLSCLEKTIRCWVNIPCSISGLERDLRTKQFREEGPLIAFRGDTRSLRQVVDQDLGFSAYSPSRCFNHACCNGEPNGCAICCGVICISGIFAGAGAFFGSLLGASAAYSALVGGGGFCSVSTIAICCDDSSTPAVICGQRQYKATFVSNWSALALSLSSDFARPYLTSSSVSYVYVVYMDACRRYDEFSHHAVRNGAKDQREDGSPVFDAKEIFPPDPKNQTIAPEQIVAAVEKNSKDAPEKSPKIFLNEKFFFFSQIKPALIAKGLDQEKLSIQMDPKEFTEILKTQLELKESPARQLMM